MEAGGDFGEAAHGGFGMDQDGVQGVAHGGALDFGVMDDARRHIPVGVPVHIGVADAHAAGQDGHCGAGCDEVNHAGAAARHQQADAVFHCQEDIHQGAVGVVHELDGGGGQAGLADGAVHQGDQGAVGAEGFLAAAQEAGVAGFEGQGYDVGGDIGAAFVDAGDDAQGDAAFFHLQAVVQGEGVQFFAHRVGEGGDGAHIGRHSVEALGREEEAVEEGGVDAGGFGVLVVGGVGLQYRGLFVFLFQGGGDAAEGVATGRAGGAGQGGCGGAGGGALLAEVLGGGVGGGHNASLLMVALLKGDLMNAAAAGPGGQGFFSGGLAGGPSLREG